ncbi:restriction modification system DNA specificity domain-containing protein [Pseudomonas sp. GM41(2012)]|uniref:restriction endonuclease subunit S n=1 Tax=Pseudomonas sp. (strain GM41(2012)) TaxID=1144708 RepID=UPI00026FF7F3|nr:restriction endonuclease subunit S [Pseudomonas sp. GM41(2012)]EUB76706.1 restriction modification system DNA specificity domain-containing protein [Pseudomonas sp. GM41(2012)]
MSSVSFMKKLLNGVAVEWKSVSEIFHLKNGYTPSKSNHEYWEGGTIPWFRMEDIRENGQILADSLQKVSVNALKGGRLFPANSIIIATSATIGEHALITVPYLANQRFTCLILRPEYIGNFDIKFIFYYCFLLADWCKKNTTMSSFASVDMDGLRSFPFPIPCPESPKKSLEIQTEIVRILDAFTYLTSELTAELTAELTVHKKQYKYYRDQLLNFEDGDVVWKKLGEVAEVNTGSKPPEIFESATSFDYINAGTSRSGYSAASNCVGDTVTTPSRGQGGIGYTGYQREPFWLGPLCYKLQSTNKAVLINKYLFYFLQSRSELLLGLKKEGGVPAVNKSDLVQLEIPIPSLEEQNRIVAILDKLDTVTKSISKGLPREIELRRKQYEYYRNLLLSFTKPEEVEA